MVVFDLDGTICDIEHRLHYIQREKKDWDTFHALHTYDLPRIDVVEKFDQHLKTEEIIAFFTGRPYKHWETTTGWLKKHLPNAFFPTSIALILEMRSDTDRRPDTEVKADMLSKYANGYDIIKIYEDRPSVIRMYREKGFEVEDVGNGVEF